MSIADYGTLRSEAVDLCPGSNVLTLKCYDPVYQEQSQVIGVLCTLVNSAVIDLGLTPTQTQRVSLPAFRNNPYVDVDTPEHGAYPQSQSDQI